MLRRSDVDPSKSVFDESVRGKTDRFVMKFQKPAQEVQGAVALHATILPVFALAQCIGRKHIGQAFQASSPKLFRPGWLVQPGLFLVRAAPAPERPSPLPHLHHRAQLPS
ncbi:hypothetical protein ELI_14315 [Erythrobacter litoralis HTCC2594]|uniref:Uncharacterized protein n=1 Tax=Erythrobacter litoralis (strain HTCC2594) TaxID=314225 RepID=Q2N5T6_ERYLH|nr:hypothetical protein ELI_14315 [Erythrobacter litoralis HTCC2594]